MVNAFKGMCYRLSIHFWPDFVLNQMAKLVPTTAAIESNSANASIIYVVLNVIFHYFVAAICKDKSSKTTHYDIEVIEKIHFITCD